MKRFTLLLLVCLSAGCSKESHPGGAVADVAGAARDPAKTLALEHARLIEESHALQTIAAELASSRRMGTLMDGIVDRTMAVLGAEGCAVWMLNELGALWPSAMRGLSDQFLQTLLGDPNRRSGGMLSSGDVGGRLLRRPPRRARHRSAATPWSSWPRAACAPSTCAATAARDRATRPPHARHGPTRPHRNGLASRQE